MVESSNQIVIDYYTQYDEDGRLERHPAEFATTVHIISNLLRILDTATGTGRYALHFARKGNQVWAEDLVPKNIEMVHALQNLRIHCIELVASPCASPCSNMLVKKRGRHAPERTKRRAR